jgi:nicotinamidase-related amidase
MSVDLTHTVLLPIDVQRGFDDPSWPPRWNAEMEASGRALLAHWRAAGAPIIHVRHDSVQPDSSLAPGHWGNGFRDGFAPQRDEPVVSKSVNSAFIGTDLDLRLRRLGAERIVTFGISTDMCVSTTIRTGVNMGWRFTLVADACDCFDLPDGKGGTIPATAIQAAHVATLAMEFCEIASTAELLGAPAAAPLKLSLE